MSLEKQILENKLTVYDKKIIEAMKENLKASVNDIQAKIDAIICKIYELIPEKISIAEVA